MTKTRTEVVEDPAAFSDLTTFANEIRQDFRSMLQGFQMLETVLGDELRACKEAIRVEVSQREEICTQLERSFNKAIEEESNKRKSVESHLDARVGTLHADISARLTEELSSTLDELSVALAGREAASSSTPTALRSQRAPTMSPLDERPEQELLERLGAAVEGEAAARRALESRLQVQLEGLASEILEALPHRDHSGPDMAAGRGQRPQHSREETPQDETQTGSHAARTDSTMGSSGNGVKGNTSGDELSWKGRDIHEAVCELHDALQDGLRREAEARAEALAALHAPELGTIVNEQDMLFKAVANLDAKISVIQEDLHLSVQQMGQQSTELITELRASKGQEAFHAASKVLSMSGLPEASGETSLREKAGLI